MTDTVSPGLASAYAKWRALVGDLRRCVSYNLRTVLQLAVAHAVELHTADGLDLFRPLDDAGEALLIDFGALAITKNLVDGEVAVGALGEKVFAVDDRGPIARRYLWGAWLVTLAALARQLEERFGRPGRGHLH